MPKLQILLSLILLRIRNKHVEPGCYLPRGDGGHVLVTEFRGLFCADVLYSHSISSPSPTLPTNTTLRGVFCLNHHRDKVTTVEAPLATAHGENAKTTDNLSGKKHGENVRLHNIAYSWSTSLLLPNVILPSSLSTSFCSFVTDLSASVARSSAFSKEHSRIINSTVWNRRFGPGHLPPPRCSQKLKTGFSPKLI